MKTQCQYCGQFQNKQGAWDGVKKEIVRTGQVTHGPCPECFEREMNKIKEMAI